jgi:hypothetical protein
MFFSIYFIPPRYSKWFQTQVCTHSARVAVPVAGRESCALETKLHHNNIYLTTYVIVKYVIGCYKINTFESLSSA